MCQTVGETFDKEDSSNIFFFQKIQYYCWCFPLLHSFPDNKFGNLNSTFGSVFYAPNYVLYGNFPYNRPLRGLMRTFSV